MRNTAVRRGLLNVMEDVMKTVIFVKREKPGVIEK
jgi:hypothetical protein